MYTYVLMLCDVYGKKNGARNCVCKGKLFDSGNYFKTRMLDLVDTMLQNLEKIQFPHQNEMNWEKQANTLVNFEILNELLYVLLK